MTFSKVFNQLCEKNKVSYAKIAEYVGYSPQAVSKWGRGETEPNFETLDKLADYFNVSIDFLLGKSDIENVINPYETDTEKELYKKIKLLSKEEQIALNNFVDATKKRIDEELDK